MVKWLVNGINNCGMQSVSLLSRFQISVKSITCALSDDESLCVGQSLLEWHIRWWVYNLS